MIFLFLGLSARSLSLSLRSSSFLFPELVVSLFSLQVHETEKAALAECVQVRGALMKI
jgi:hypothetical protein